MSLESMMLIEPLSGNRIRVSTGDLKLELIVTAENKSMNIKISDNCRWDIDKIRKDRNYLTIKKIGRK